MKRYKKVSKPPTIDERYVDMGDQSRWYCVQIQPQLRETAVHNLNRQGFVPFFPLLLRRRGKRTWTETMFKGYGFVQFDPSATRWQSINGTYGVVGMLPRHRLYPVPMPLGLIERLRDTDPTPEDDFYRAFEEYYPGITQVEVTEDHRLLAGRSGVYLDRRGSLLQVAFHRYDTKGTGPAVWIDEDYVRPSTAAVG